MRRIIKIIISIIVVLIALVVLTACGENKKKEVKVTSNIDSIVKKYEKAIREKDIKSLTEMVNIGELNSVIINNKDKEVTKAELEEYYTQLFKEYRDELNNYEVEKYTKIDAIDNLKNFSIGLSYYGILGSCIQKGLNVYALEIIYGEKDKDYDYIILNEDNDMLTNIFIINFYQSK